MDEKNNKMEKIMIHQGESIGITKEKGIHYIFSSKFFGSIEEKFLDVDEISIQFNEVYILSTKYIDVEVETVISPRDKQAYFFFLFKELFFGQDCVTQESISLEILERELIIKILN